MNRNRQEVGSFDKSDWGDGPWQDEPDGGAWGTRAGLVGAFVRHPVFGNLNGYVAVPPEHPLYGKGYQEAGELEVHGDLTFAGHLSADVFVNVATKDIGPGLWWFGFDTAHGWDYCPAMAARERALGFPLLDRPRSYKPLSYVQAQVESLAEQLAALAVPA